MQKMYMTHPIFPTPNIKQTADFYVQKLGFNAVEYLNSKEPHICLYKDDIEIILTDSNGQKVVPNHELYGYGYDVYITESKSEIKEGPYPVVCSTSIMGYHNEYKVKAPGVVIGRSGTLGEVQFIDTDYWPHNTSLYVSDFKGNSPKFIKYFLQLFGTGNVGGGSAVPTLNRNHLQALTVY